MNDPLPQTQLDSSHIQITWKDSYWIMLLIALCIGLSSILFSLTVDRFLHGVFRQIFASDWLEALLVAAITAAALLRIQRNQRELVRRMQIVEDVNHHVRNALTSIVLSASLNEDPELNARIRDACARIDWVLSDVLSQSIHAKAGPDELSRWRAGRKL
jgi:signal transduction histidine kinase